MKISEHFQQTNNSEPTHTWTLISHDDNLAPIDSLAECLADKIMELRCIGCPHHYIAWKQRSANGTALSPTALAALGNGFIKPVFGLPDSPINKDHLEGAISQYLWYFLILESPNEETIRVERPGFAAIDHGGDGLAIHRVNTGQLMFRLWEIKKCTGDSPVSSTINTAYKQLNEQATEYLARYTTIGQEIHDAEMEEFYGKLVELWLEASPAAAIGVAVAVNNNDNNDGIPSKCFTTFGNQFPRFLDPKRLHGMLTAIKDFSGFSIKVQQAIWKGL